MRRTDRVVRYKFIVEGSQTIFRTNLNVNAEALTRVQIISLPENCSSWKVSDGQTMRLISDNIPESIKDISFGYQFANQMATITFELFADMRTDKDMIGDLELLVTLTLHSE